MKQPHANTAFDTLSHRVVDSYRRLLREYVPSEDTPPEMRRSRQDLHAFFVAFYQRAYAQPALFGLPTTPDIFTKPGDNKEEKQVVARKIKPVHVKMRHGPDFLYLAGQQGTLVDGQLHLEPEPYAVFFNKQKRAKRKMLQGLHEVGLTCTEQEDAVLISSDPYPHMMPALQSLALACQEHEKQGMVLFTRCDFGALAPDYAPDSIEMLKTALSAAEYEHALKMHHLMLETGHTPTVELWHASGWAIRYQGKRKIKTSPFFQFDYDDRRKHPLMTTVKCASTNRLVPLLDQQPDRLQKDFFDYANNCGAENCGWCKTRKGMNPSVIKYNGAKRLICWYLQRHFYKLDDQAVELVKHYTLFHEALLTI